MGSSIHFLSLVLFRLADHFGLVTARSSFGEFLDHSLRIVLLCIQHEGGKRPLKIYIDILNTGDRFERVTHALRTTGPSGHAADGKLDLQRFGHDWSANEKQDDNGCKKAS